MSLKFEVDEQHFFDAADHDNWIPLGNGKFHCLHNGKKVVAEVKSISPNNKSIEIRLAGHNYKVQVQDKLDQLIKEMGLENIEDGKLDAVHAPMPGMVLEILVEPGQKIETGMDLLILEAMKMENVIQASGEGVVSNISIQKGAAVDKGQLLIEME